MLKYVIGIVVLTGWRLVGRSGGRPRGHGEHRRLYLWEIIEQGLDDMEGLLSSRRRPRTRPQGLGANPRRRAHGKRRLAWTSSQPKLTG